MDKTKEQYEAIKVAESLGWRLVGMPHLVPEIDELCRKLGYVHISKIEEMLGKKGETE